MRIVDLTGRRYGRWLVLKRAPNRNGRVFWTCKCDCGTIKDVPGGALRQGQSQSCGCITRERLSRRFEAHHENIKGKRFGRWTVLEKAPSRNGRVYWTCQCDCGTVKNILGSSLTRKKSESCGCVNRDRLLLRHDNFHQTLIGQKFGRLTVIAKSHVNHHGQVLLRCKCDCNGPNSIVNVVTSHLTTGKTKSCGCINVEILRSLCEFGTNTYAIASDKISRRNTSGVKGVYKHRDKWIAEIMFRGKKYHLGTYNDLEAATRARKEAEDKLHRNFLKWYEDYKKGMQTNE